MSAHTAIGWRKCLPNLLNKLSQKYSFYQYCKFCFVIAVYASGILTVSLNLGFVETQTIFWENSPNGQVTLPLIECLTLRTGVCNSDIPYH